MQTSKPASRPAWVDDDLFPFESHFADVQGNSVHYVDEGTGPVLLMLHGNPTWSFVYRDVIASLRDRFRCIALDYPGFGLSTAAPGYGYLPADHADVVTAFVDRLDLRDITPVMQDWGGPIGLTMAERRPERVSHLVLANTWAWPVNGQPRAEFVSRTFGGLIGRGLIRRFNLFVNGVIPAGHKLRKVTPAEMTQYRRALDTTERRNACALLPGQILGARDLLTRVDADLPTIRELPTLIVWGDKDFAFVEADRERLEATFPNHTTVIAEGASHFVQSDAPRVLADAIAAWYDDPNAEEVPG